MPSRALYYCLVISNHFTLVNILHMSLQLSRTAIQTTKTLPFNNNVDVVNSKWTLKPKLPLTEFTGLPNIQSSCINLCSTKSREKRLRPWKDWKRTVGMLISGCVMVLIEVSLNFSRSSLVSESRIFSLKPHAERLGYATHAITGS